MNPPKIPSINLTESQRLLLAALAAVPGDVRPLYEQWAAATSFDNLDGGSYRLMPMLYKKLVPLGINDDVLYEKIKGIYRYTLYKNSLALAGLHEILRALSEAGVPVMLLKGGAMILKYYPDRGMRPMNDIDLLVEENNLTPALHALAGLGWRDIEQKVYDLFLGGHPAVTMAGGRRFELDVHWNLLTEYDPQIDPRVWWRDARLMDWQGSPVYLLSPEDQVIHLCAHGVKWDALPSIRWIPDVLRVLEASPDLAWDKLVQKCQYFKVTLPVRSCLLFLQTRYGAQVPDEVLDALFSRSVSKTERKRFERYTAPLSFFQRVVRQWGLCRKDFPDRTWMARAWRFPAYLKRKSGIEKYSDCAVYLFHSLSPAICAIWDKRRSSLRTASMVRDADVRNG